jgi:hypothetical protein
MTYDVRRTDLASFTPVPSASSLICLYHMFNICNFSLGYPTIRTPLHSSDDNHNHNPNLRQSTAIYQPTVGTVVRFVRYRLSYPVAGTRVYLRERRWQKSKKSKNSNQVRRISMNCLRLRFNSLHRLRLLPLRTCSCRRPYPFLLPLPFLPPFPLRQPRRRRLLRHRRCCVKKEHGNMVRTSFPRNCVIGKSQSPCGTYPPPPPPGEGM